MSYQLLAWIKLVFFVAFLTEVIFVYMILIMVLLQECSYMCVYVCFVRWMLMKDGSIITIQIVNCLSKTKHQMPLNHCKYRHHRIQGKIWQNNWLLLNLMRKCEFSTTESFQSISVARTKREPALGITMSHFIRPAPATWATECRNNWTDTTTGKGGR